MSTDTEPDLDLDDVDSGMDSTVDSEEEPDEVEATTTRKRKPKGVNDPFKHPDGHNLIDGARWHYPKTGSPSECAVPGCERVLTRHLKADIVDTIEPDDEAPADEVEGQAS